MCLCVRARESERAREKEKREKDEDKMDEDQAEEEEEEVPAILSVIAVPLAKDKLVKKLLKLVKSGEPSAVPNSNA